MEFFEPVDRSIASHGCAIVHVRGKLTYAYTIGLTNRSLSAHPELIVFAATTNAAHCALSAALRRLKRERVYRHARLYSKLYQGADAAFIEVDCFRKGYLAFARVHHGRDFDALQMVVKDCDDWLERFPLLGSAKAFKPQK